MNSCTICQRKPDVITPADMRMLGYAQPELQPEFQPEFQLDMYGKKERRPLRCKACGSTDVRWRRQGGEWTMFSMQPGVLHVCDTSEDFE